MHHVVSTLKPGSRGEEVSSLNSSLVFLLVEGSALLDMKQPTLSLDAGQLKKMVHQDAEYYGSVTELLISLFQKKHQLPETGELNEETAGELNTVLSHLRAFDRQVQYGPNDQALKDSWRDGFRLADIGDLTIRLTPAKRLPREALGQSGEISVIHKPSEEKEDDADAPRLLRLSIKCGEYTYAKSNDIVMIESSDHFTVVHVAHQQGKVKTSLRNSCLKKVLQELPQDSFLRVNRFCAINLNRLSGGSYHQQFFEFDHCIKVKPRHPLSHAVFHSIGN